MQIPNEELLKIIEESLPAVMKEMLSRSYSNPIRDAIEEEIKSNDGLIKQTVKELLATVLTNAEFKEKITQELVSTIIKKGLRE